jgi:putative membrane-bound dehydrogenase-like protein
MSPTTNSRTRYPLFIAATAGLLILGCGKEHKTARPPHPPEEALATIQVAEGFRVELVAAEPLVADPVAMEIDEAGRVYVVEMHGYPLDKGGSGKIKLLTDTDGDGKMDKSTVFAEGLTLPNGIMRWKNGVIVTDAPDVLYLEDQDHDGRADVRKVLLTGFALSNPQHNLNTPLYGLDNWIYLAHEPAVTANVYPKEFGDAGKAIVFPGVAGAPSLPVNAAGRNVRFRPDAHELEILSGASQFGQTFDTWGHHFGVSNARHLFQEVLAARYALRNPDLLLSRSTQSLPDHGDAAEVFPITQNPQHQLLTDVGVITSACAVTSYLGGAFPEGFEEAVFVGEPVHNIVHVDKLSPKGASFTASRLYRDREFLASTDSWFRPVNFYVGPDGALYVMDYYRQIIEHPEWMSEEVNASGALYNGTDKGRIYRVVPTKFAPAANQSSLAGATAPELVKALAHQNSWWRRTAQRLLVDKKEPATVGPLTQLVRESKFAPARLHALWTLEGMGKLDTSLIVMALRDPAAGVRENAVKLAELHLEQHPALADHLLPLGGDPDAKVRYQVLCTLGEVPGAAADQARRQILFQDVEDEWVHLAALSAPAVDPVAVYRQALDRLGNQESEGGRHLLRQVCAMIGERDKTREISSLIRSATAPAASEGSAWWQAASLEGLAAGMRGHSYPKNSLLPEREMLVGGFQANPPAVRQASLRVLQRLGVPEGPVTRRAMQSALSTALDKGAEAQLRADAIGLLALEKGPHYTAQLQTLVAPAEPALVQRVAVQTLAGAEGPEIGSFFLSKWNTLTPEIRDHCVNAFMSDPARMRQLLGGIERGIVQPSTIGWPRSVALMNDENPSIRAYARRLLEEKPGVREAVVEQYQAALTLTGNAAHGKVVYKQVCAACHQVGGTGGKAFGPDLASLKNRKPEAILRDILMPNRSIADGYEWWEVKEKNGKVSAGIIGRETAGTITLHNLAGPEITIPRTEIGSLQSSNVSVMPSGLEKQIDERQMADLLAFLKAARIE